MARRTNERTDPRRGRLLRRVAAAVALLLLVGIAGGAWAYRHFEGNIETIPETGLGKRPAKVVKEDVPQQPLNILLLGSDSRAGQSSRIGGDTPGLSDTTIVLHLSAERDRAVAVSIPRDSMVQLPSCQRKDGSSYPGGLDMFNEAFAIGGPTCTLRAVESLTDVRMDHVVVVDFDGFKRIVDALGGVEICVPRTIDDDIGHIHLDEGTYTVDGQKALDYVRIRHVISPNSDIGRMARQQAFLASMAEKAVSLGTLTNPVRLYKFLDAVTSSISADEDLAHLSALVDLAKEVRKIGLEDVRFMTVPFEAYEADSNRLQWKQPDADRLWRRLELDLPLDRRQRQESTSAGGGTPSTRSAQERAEARAAANGLCA